MQLGVIGPRLTSSKATRAVRLAEAEGRGADSRSGRPSVQIRSYKPKVDMTRGQRGREVSFSQRPRCSWGQIGQMRTSGEAPWAVGSAECEGCGAVRAE